ncbi:MAG TPA: type II 3-dehydroquinate dehydratase [Sphingomonadales bacterium]|nr:type II 3-dehydroquinate dehydratase [Sphingomonadales bacterium]
MAQPTQKPVFVLNGPNLNRLGAREPTVYGEATLRQIEQALAARAKALGLTLVCRQSNHEGDLVDWIQEAGEKGSGLIINPGGYSHTSVAVRDALAGVSIPAIEVHISNIHARETFRQTSLMSSVVTGVICGLGTKGYELALEAVAAKLT